MSIDLPVLRKQPKNNGRGALHCLYYLASLVLWHNIGVCLFDPHIIENGLEELECLSSTATFIFATAYGSVILMNYDCRRDEIKSV